MPVRDNPGISDEQNFDAVSARETIESDAERLARLSAEYQVVQPEALPEREGDTGPNIVAFALQTTNARGPAGLPPRRASGPRRGSRPPARATPRPTRRSGRSSNAGGPEDDRLGVDPDGDGFACTWDPTPVPRGARRLRPVEIVHRPSPNCGERRGGARPALVVLHYTAMAIGGGGAGAALRSGGRGLVPLADRRGRARLALVAEEMRAWHAGAGTWGGEGGRELALHRDRAAE